MQQRWERERFERENGCGPKHAQYVAASPVARVSIYARDGAARAGATASVDSSGMDPAHQLLMWPGCDVHQCVEKCSAVKATVGLSLSSRRFIVYNLDVGSL